MKNLLRLLAVLLLALLGVLLFNALRLKSYQLKGVGPAAPVPLPDSAVARLAAAVRLPTVSTTDPAATDTLPFARLGALLDVSFPLVRQRLRCQKINHYARLYEWPGRNPALKPMLLAAHLDVVPVLPGTEAKWAQPPFAGRAAGGYLYGRGTLDDKAAVLGLLEAVEGLLRQDFRPERTVLLAFGHDEETTGQRGAAAIAAVLARRHPALEYVLDEGGIVRAGGVASVKQPVALVGISEKGYLSLELSATGQGGHASMPPPRTSIGLVAEAVARLEAQPFPARLDGGVGTLLDYLAPEMPFTQRLVFANRWLFAPLIKKELAKTAAGNATLRTTTAPTILRAGAKDNVLPIDATATVNFRLLPGDSVAGVIGRVREIIGNDAVRVRVLGQGRNPAPVSSPAAPAFGTVQRSIMATFAGAVVAPYTVVGATDGRAYARLTPSVFRFLPVPDHDLASLHGSNERLKITDYQRMIQFYTVLIRNSQQ